MEEVLFCAGCGQELGMQKNSIDMPEWKSEHVFECPKCKCVFLVVDFGTNENVEKKDF